MKRQHTLRDEEPFVIAKMSFEYEGIIKTIMGISE